MYWLRLSLAACLLLPQFIFGGSGEPDFKGSMCRDLDFIRSAFESKYAPASWKKKFSDWDLATEIELAKERVRRGDGRSVKSYQRILHQLLNSTKDYHVGVTFYSTEQASLPFEVASANDHYYITYIDRDRLPVRSFPFNEGDELVTFDKRPTDEVVQELLDSELANANLSTDKALAEIYLTLRRGKLGHIVPRGPVSIAVKSAKTGQVSSHQIIWDYTPEKIKNPTACSVHQGVESRVNWPAKLGQHPFFRKMLLPYFLLDNAPAIAKQEGSHHPNELGGRESFIPPLSSQKLWETDASNPFYAYIFAHPDTRRNIGYVRIPHYTADELEVQNFAAIISKFERETDALIIDQVNNPGGSVFYLYALASMLTDHPLYTPRHRMTLTQEDIFFALEAQKELEKISSDDEARGVLGESFSGYPVSYQFSQFILNFFRFVIDEWNEGHTFTTPYYLYGVDQINPHPAVRYTKPILVLINGLDFSGGDFFPAILQDNRRVTLFGSRTAGAGGFVDGFSYPNLFGVAAIQYTASIAERMDNNPIENLGVIPDITYDLTQKDFQNNYEGYSTAVLKAVESIRR